MSVEYSDDRRRWWSKLLAPRLRRNRGQLLVHVRYGRRNGDDSDAAAGKQFKQFLRFGR